MTKKGRGCFVAVSALCHGTLASIVAALVLVGSDRRFEPPRGAQRMIVLPAIPLPQVSLTWTGVGVSLLNTFLVASVVGGLLRAAYKWLPVKGPRPAASSQDPTRLWWWCALLLTLLIGIGVPILSAQHNGTFIWCGWR